MVFTVAGAGCAKANGIFKPVDMPNYSGVQAYSNGAVVLYRWHKKHWVLRCVCVRCSVPTLGLLRCRRAQ